MLAWVWETMDRLLVKMERRRRQVPPAEVDPQLLQAAPAALTAEQVRALAIRCLRAERQVDLARAMIHSIVPLLQTLGQDGYVEATSPAEARDWLVTCQQVGLIPRKNGEFRKLKLTASGRE
ncbi:MAG: hypothetical protein GX591_02390 [Planctomycetes bacterium]|nr:hypothetical protein [Planctomycetota bacterium]